MRQPKYRGYSRETNQWHYGHGWFAADYTNEFLKERGINQQAVLHTDGYPVECELSSMGQFTGETDIKDKPIVEGDVVEFDLFGDGEKEKGVVVYKQAAFLVQTDYVPPMDGTHLGRPLAYELGELIKNEKDVEIIGNEFEHLVGD